MARRRREREPRTVNYAPEDRPFIDVRHDADGQWYPGRLHAWVPDEDGVWWSVVSYFTEPGVQYYRGVPATEIRRKGNPLDAR